MAIVTLSLSSLVSRILLSFLDNGLLDVGAVAVDGAAVLVSSLSAMIVIVVTRQPSIQTTITLIANCQGWLLFFGERSFTKRLPPKIAKYLYL